MAAHPMNMSFSDSSETALRTSPDSPASSVRIPFQNTYAQLPGHFFARLHPTPVAAPRLIELNRSLCVHLGLDPEALASREGVEILAGSRVAMGSEPLAQAYAGHQFGHFVPQLGDGRTNLLGEVIGLDGKRYDLQLKGSGPTPFSRRGDGRAALGPVLREYLVSEAMAAMGVPTTRALAAIATGEPVVRETMLPGAVLTRVAASHLRVGTFQYFAAQGDVEGLRALAEHAIGRHYPSAAKSGRPIRFFLEGVIGRQARLVAQWMLLGFIHGVMNTDNTSISGETIDYGPCAFLEAYDPAKVFSSIDHQGRYAYSNQPHAMHWNLVRLAEALLPLLVEEAGSNEAGPASAYEALATFAPQFDHARSAGLCRKLGLLTHTRGNIALADDLLERMAKNRADFTLTFRRLCDAAEEVSADEKVGALFNDPASYHSWAAAWRTRLDQEEMPAATRAATMRACNPAVIPRNHRVQEVIDAAVQRQDFQPFQRLLQAVTHPWERCVDRQSYEAPAKPDECIHATFCGT